MLDPLKSPLLTDLYQLTMLEAYFEHGLTDTAAFEFFARRLPDPRGFLLAAGLESLIEFLEGLRFTEEDLDWVRRSGRFKPAFADRLATLRFTGDVDAMPEGTPVFANEPLVRVVAPLPEAQLIETRLINIVHYQTLVASKAARSVLAAPGRLLVDFGLRRAHAGEAGMFSARASYLAGFGGSANVAAAAAYGLPVYGTMAHSFVQAHDREEEAFERFAVTHPTNNTLLIDTYDTEAAAHKVVHLARRLQDLGITINAVRLDSGDLAAHAVNVRKILDDGGFRNIRIFASGNLDEYLLAELMRRGAPIDGFGVGTHLDTSSDAPHFDCVYKLMEYAGRARRKRSEGKATLPGRKQIYRRHGPGGEMTGDVLTIMSDRQEGEPLLVPVMRGGRRVAPPQPLSAIRERTVRELARLPAHLRALGTSPPYPVTVASALSALAEQVDRMSG
jgi:nicotinate phosphoribosyltransferase